MVVARSNGSLDGGPTHSANDEHASAMCQARRQLEDDEVMIGGVLELRTRLGSVTCHDRDIRDVLEKNCDETET